MKRRNVRQELSKLNTVQLANPYDTAQGGSLRLRSDRLAYLMTATQQKARKLPTPEKVKGYDGFGDVFQVLSNRPPSLLILPDTYAGILTLDNMTPVDKPSPFDLSKGRG